MKQNNLDSGLTTAFDQADISDLGLGLENTVNRKGHFEFMYDMSFGQSLMTKESVLNMNTATITSSSPERRWLLAPYTKGWGIYTGESKQFQSKTIRAKGTPMIQ